MREIFTPGIEFLPTDGLFEALNADKEAPWADWKAGITAEKLGRLLKAYGVKSERRQTGGSRNRGYARESLEPVFNRYLAPCSKENEQPGHSPAEALPELIRAGQVQQSQLGHGQVQNSNPATAEPLPEPIPGQVARIRAESEGAEGKEVVETVNGVKLTPKEKTQKLKFAVESFDNVIGRPDEPEPELPQSSPPSLPAKPGFSALETRLLSALAPHDYEGGLSYGQWRRRARLPDEVFDQTVKSLCRRAGPVYKSALNSRYQLSPRFAEILVREKKQWDVP